MLLSRVGAKHICGAPWFKEMLEERGIPAEPVLFPYDTSAAESYPQPPLPQKPYRICTYLSRGSWENSHGSQILELAALTPFAEWTVFGMGSDDLPGGSAAPGNMKFLGWVKDTLAVMAQNHALIRWVGHDAYSGTVRDAQAMGKTVLYSKQVNGIVPIAGKTVGEVASIIEYLASGGALGKADGFSLPPFRMQITALREAVG